jgi:hypothetical protein
MKYDVLITHIGNPKAKNIIAHHLAHDPSTSLQKALSLLENPPVVYMTGLLKDDALYQVKQLEKIQVTAKLVEVQLAPLRPHTVAPFAPEHGAPLPQQPVQHTQQVSPAAPPSPQPVQPQHPAPNHVAEPAPKTAADTPAAAGGAGSWIKMTKNQIIAVSSVSAALLVLVIVIFALKGTFDWGHAFTLDWSKAGLVSSDVNTKKTDIKKAKQERKRPDSADKKKNPAAPVSQDTGGETEEATEEQASKAEAYINSGKNAADISQAMAFYQLAIAFNKRNVNAWYALHDAYASAQMDADAAKTEKEMRRLFGDNIFSVSKIIEPFGAVRSMSMTRDGIYRVEYQPRESNQGKILFDSYLLTKSLQKSCLCNAISLYARTSGGKGMLVYVRTESFPASFEEYKASANITYLK